MAEPDDDDFVPKLSRIRSAGGTRAKSFLNEVLHKASGEGQSGARARSSQTFSGRRIGRGNDPMRRRRAGHRFGPSHRRVVIKSRIVKLKGVALGAARAHLRYLQRDGVSKDLEPGRLYDGTHDEVDGARLLERSEGDRHQFRFIVSPEDAHELAELKPFVRDLMATMERDLGTRLDWVAVDHFNTDNPHTHIVLRGKDELGEDLVIARDYISHGMREAAGELLTLELGPVTQREVRRKLESQVDQDRFTDLDRDLIRDADDGVVDARPDFSGHADRLEQAVRIGRLQKLQSRDLAQEIAPGRWQLADRLEDTLRRSGERGDIVKTMHRGLQAAGIEAGASNYAIYDPGEPRAPLLTGRIIDRGMHDELADGHYVLLDAQDGRVHYVALDPNQDMDDVPIGGIVEVGPAERGVKPADRTIASIAREHDGIYSTDLHYQADPRASDAFVKAHVRRLEALRRHQIVQRFADGSWQIPNDFEDRAARHAAARSRYPGRVATLSFLSLEAQVTANGATWLDRQLVEPNPTSFRGQRMDAAVAEARERRIGHLVAAGLSSREGGNVRHHRHLLRTLRQRELAEVGTQLEKVLDKSFLDTPEGARTDGVYARSVRLASGKFAVLEQSREFALVPWRPELERQRGKSVSVTVHGTSVSYEIGRQRGRGLG